MKSSVSSLSSGSSNPAAGSEALLLQVFAKLDAMAFGIAVGLWAALCLSAATILLLIDGGPLLGRHLELLGQYFVGYKVTWTGSIVGFAYGFAGGFCVGWLIAFLRNLCISIY